MSQRNNPTKNRLWNIQQYGEDPNEVGLSMMNIRHKKGIYTKKEMAQMEAKENWESFVSNQIDIDSGYSELKSQFDENMKKYADYDGELDLVMTDLTPKLNASIDLRKELRRNPTYMAGLLKKYNGDK